jgi:hypothetical protein
MDQEPLGRFASSLQKLPSVIWANPLSVYLDLSLAELRSMKAYGDKRVNAIIDIFGALHRTLTAIDCNPHLAAQLTCRTTFEIDRWLKQFLVGDRAPSYQELRVGLVEPVLKQLRLDAGDPVADLAESRLELFESWKGVGDIARRMKLTRARIHQLFDHINAIMQLRWPSGPSLLVRLNHKLVSLPTQSSALQLFRATAALCFPSIWTVEASEGRLESNVISRNVRC